MKMAKTLHKVALITGGASGFGLAVATALSDRGNWTVHLLDLNESAGKAVASSLPSAYFHKVDVTSYAALANAFDAAFTISGGIDFVFANAGIVERDDFYKTFSASGPPPEPDQLSLDINLKSVINTTYLAQHYFRQSPHKGKDAVLIMTSSSGGIYPSYFCPIYTAAKHGVIGLMRAVARDFYRRNGIRTAAICPGSVRTNLLDAKTWSSFPQSFFTPIENIAKIVTMCIDGGKMVDSRGREVPAGQGYGLAIEIMGNNFYFADQPEWCNEDMKLCMESTDSSAVKVS